MHMRVGNLSCRIAGRTSPVLHMTTAAAVEFGMWGDMAI